MTRVKTHFGIGLAVGILIAVLFLYYFAPRYTTVKSGQNLIKQDRWSGGSWRFVDGQWKKIRSQSRDWGKVDEALRHALNIPTGEVKRTDSLSLLKEKYPVLKDVSDDDLLERIKIVYSKEILCNLYLSNFHKLESGSQEHTGDGKTKKAKKQ